MIQSKPPIGNHRTGVNAGSAADIVSDEYLNSYKFLCGEIFEEWQPVGVIEKRLVQTLADCKWKADRAKARKRAVYAKTLTGEPLAIAQVKVLTQLQQSGLRFQHAFQKTVKALQGIQGNRKQRQPAKRSL